MGSQKIRLEMFSSTLGTPFESDCVHYLNRPDFEPRYEDEEHQEDALTPPGRRQDERRRAEMILGRPLRRRDERQERHVCKLRIQYKQFPFLAILNFAVLAIILILLIALMFLMLSQIFNPPKHIPLMLTWLDARDTQSKDLYRAIMYTQWLQYEDENTTDAELILNNKIKTSDKVISCYYNMPSQKISALQPSAIHPYLCTHINVAFASVEDSTIYLSSEQKDIFKEVVNLKMKNPNLKVLLSIGGAGVYNGFSHMVIDHASRKKFIRSIKSFLKEYKGDGIDLDWEFPAISGNFRERQHLSQLLREIRVEFWREKHDYMLTIAAASPKFLVEQCYDISQLNLYTDYVNIMTYDYHFFSTYTPFTGLNAPLYTSDTFGYLSTLSINYTINMYIEKGLSPDKIVMGIPTYGHSFYLWNKNNTGLGSPAGIGVVGYSGFADYPDICKYIEHNKDVVLKTDKIGKVPYLYQRYDWISYENEASVMLKAEYVKENHLRGAMIYSLNADDHQGMCNLKLMGKFPLANSIKSALFDDISVSQNS